MQINVTVYSEKESFTMSADEAAAAVLTALGGDPTKDSCSVTLSWTPETGAAGTISGLPTP
jgi:hypothetical protein